MIFRLTCVRIISSSVSVAEWPASLGGGGGGGGG